MGGNSESVSTSATLHSKIPVTDPYLEVSICYDYSDQSGTFTGCYSKKIQLPMYHFSYIVALEKDAPFKLTIDVNKELPEAFELFREYISNSNPNAEFCNNPNALTFRFNHGAKATILIAKNSNKMRFQGDTFDSIFLLLSEVNTLLLRKDSSYKLGYTKDLPLKDFIDILQERMNILKDLGKQEELLEEKTNEIMHIMKRLVTR